LSYPVSYFLTDQTHSVNHQLTRLKHLCLCNQFDLIVDINSIIYVCMWFFFSIVIYIWQGNIFQKYVKLNIHYLWSIVYGY
jgi:hypothetical protein